MFDDYKIQESLLDGGSSCETTEDLYEPSDDELLYPSRHYETIGFDWGSSKGSYESVAKYSVNEDGSINF